MSQFIITEQEAYNQEPRRDRKERLDRQNRWEEFKELREKLKKQKRPKLLLDEINIALANEFAKGTKEKGPIFTWDESLWHPVLETRRRALKGLPSIEDEARERAEEATKNIPEEVEEEEETSARYDMSSIIDKTASFAEEIEYVAKHIYDKELKVEEAPSPAAFNLLIWVRVSPKNETEFYKNHYKAVSMAKSKEDEKSKVDDTGKEVVKAIEYMQKYRKAEGLDK